MRACGWEVIDVEYGCFDIPSLIDALHRSQELKCGKPGFINIRTIIGVGSAVAGTAVAHGAAFSTEDIAGMKKAYGFTSDEHLYSEKKLDHFLRIFLPEKRSWWKTGSSFWHRIAASIQH